MLIPGSTVNLPPEHPNAFKMYVSRLIEYAYACDKAFDYAAYASQMKSNGYKNAYHTENQKVTDLRQRYERLAAACQCKEILIQQYIAALEDEKNKNRDYETALQDEKNKNSDYGAAFKECEAIIQELKVELQQMKDWLKAASPAIDELEEKGVTSPHSPTQPSLPDTVMDELKSDGVSSLHSPIEQFPGSTLTDDLKQKEVTTLEQYQTGTKRQRPADESGTQFAPQKKRTKSRRPKQWTG